jgi:zinc protease
MSLLVVESHTLPLVSAELYVRSGAAADPADRSGTASMMAAMLDKGTPTRNAVQIAETVEGVGGTLGAGADQDNLTLAVSVLSDQLPLAFELLSDLALRPTFPESEIQTVRGQMVAGLRAAQGQPGTLAARMFEQVVYGASHPYGRRATAASVQAITRDDLLAWHRRHFVPGNALLVVSGDITPARAEEMARRHFGAWTGGAAPADEFPTSPTPGATAVSLIHRPGSVQSTLYVGHTGLTPDNPDYFAVQVLNMVLGASGDSRLEKVLRGEHGWTYGARSGYQRLLGGGDFRASTEVRTAVTDSALAETLVQLRRIRDEPVPQAELEQAKSSLVASFPNTMETASQAASRLAGTRLLGLPAEHLTQYAQRVAAVTAADVQRVARQYLHPDRAAIIVVGDAAQVLERLRAIAPVSVFDVEGKPLDPR